MNIDKRNSEKLPTESLPPVNQKTEALLSKSQENLLLQEKILQELITFKTIKSLDELKVNIEQTSSLSQTEKKDFIDHIESQSPDEVQKYIDQLNKKIDNGEKQVEIISNSTGENILGGVFPNYSLMKSDLCHSDLPHKQVGALCLGLAESVSSIGYYGLKFTWDTIRSPYDIGLILAGKASTDSFKNV